MATIEMVEKLREKANVSYEEAKAALDACGDDILDAMIYLERQGKVTAPSGGGSYSSEYEPHAHHKSEQEFVKHAKKKEEKQQQRNRDNERFKSSMRRFGDALSRLLHAGNSNNIEVWKDGELIFSMPVTVLVLLIIFCFWAIIPLSIIGLFFNFRYRFTGRHLEDSCVNRAMESVANAAESIKEEARAHHPENNDHH